MTFTNEERREVAARLRGLRGFVVDGKKFCSCYDVEDALGLEGSIMCSRTAVADRIDLEMVEYERLKKENAELKKILACWQNARLDMLARAKKLAGMRRERGNFEETVKKEVRNGD